MLKRLAILLSALALLLYPLAVYFGLQVFKHQQLALLLIVVFALRLMLVKHIKRQIPWMNGVLVSVVALLLATAIFDLPQGVLFYPVLMNTALCLIFAYSLYKKPSVIETLARIQEPDLPEPAIAYTEKVTAVWCVFFVINGCIAAYTALYTSIEVWTLYNGLIAYLAMALLMAIEFTVRLFVKKKHRELK